MKYESSLRFDEKAKALYVKITGHFHGMAFSHPILDYDSLKTRKARVVVLDLSDVHMVNSRGVRSLLIMKEEVESKGLSFKILCTNESILTLFRDLSLTELFTLIKSPVES